MKGAQWISGRVLDLRLRDRGFEPHRRHCVVSLARHINPSLARSVAGQPQTRNPSSSSQALYHWATALPKIREGSSEFSPHKNCTD